jgi:hypothetical protein
MPASLAWLAAGAVGIAVIAGSIGYAVARFPTGSLLNSLTRRAVAQEPPTPMTPAAARAAGSTAAGTAGANGAAAANQRKPTGTVTQVSPDPPSFTVQAADGTMTTYSVLPTTVFMAGRDRPYHFDLLKTGDTVVVRGGQIGLQASGQQPAAVASPTTANGAAAARPRVAARAIAQRAAAANSGEPIARIVVVRPVGEGDRVGNGQNSAANSGQNGAAQNGGIDGAGQ